MTSHSTRKTQRLVLVGAGHAHVEVLRSFSMRPMDALDLVLVNPSSEAYYSGMLPGVVSGQYKRREAVIDAASLATRAGAILIRDEAVGIDVKGRHIQFRHHPDLLFDWLSIDIGSSTRRPAAPASARILAPRPFHEFLSGLESWDEEMRADAVVSVIGGGAAGYELSCALRARYPDAKIVLVDGGVLSQAQRKPLEKRRISFVSGRVERLEGAGPVSIRFVDGSVRTSDYVVTAMGAEAPALFATVDLPKHEGFLAVNECLQVKGQPIFAAGDCAATPFAWVKKAGVYAVREGPVLTRNLRASVRGASLESFHPQKRFLRLLNLCDGSAIAEWGALRAEAAWAWKWKDRIDRGFMEKYAARAMPMEEPECGGCGGKVSADLLREALADSLPLAPSPDTEWGVAAAEDVAIQRLGGVRMASTVDEFRNFGADPWTYGRIAAVSAASDLYAKGIAPRSALLSVTLPKYAEELAVDWLKQLLAGARSVLGPEGVEVLGGQTSEGNEWRMGLSLWGLVESEPWPKRGAQAGDILVLTKPLGTGVLLAAAMQGAALGRDLDSALRSMEQSQRAAWDLLQTEPPRASTDVTGFSLIGHLSEMLGGDSGAELRFTDIPFLPGAREWYARGFKSRMHALNARSFRADLGASEDTAILYDPQTSGGLLLAVTPERASACVKRLHVAGYASAACIGTVTNSGGIRVR